MFDGQLVKDQINHQHAPPVELAAG